MSPDMHAFTGAYALDALTDDERIAFERHLAGCDPCRREIDAFVATAALLGTATARRPPASLRPRVLGLVDATRQLPAEPAGGSDVPVGVSGLQRALAAVAAALALALVLVTAHAARLDEQVTELEAQLARQDGTGALGTLVAAPDLRSVALEGADGAVRFLWSDQLDRGVLAADGLRPLPGSHSYQLWLFHDGVPRPAGLLPPDGGATVEVTTATVRGAETVAITVEPRGGSPTPSGPVVASAHL